jgi:hypothetical protein|tara:strand:- start:304 stop:1008 length:705 start_codon:yes stop_codon:yes gene_type:complete
MSTPPFLLEDDERVIKAVAKEWCTLTNTEILAWERDFTEMQAEQRDLAANGAWVAGPADLLTIIGRSRRETYHSAVIAWLLEPGGRHRLGTTFLRAILDKCLTEGEFDTDDLAACVTDTEVDAASSRADIVVSGPGLHLVIEVKVDAAEGPNQCQRLFDDHNGSEAGFVFLTPSGGEPRSCNDDIRAVWAPLSFGWIANELENLMASQAEQIATDMAARGTVRSYLATLRKEFR